MISVDCDRYRQMSRLRHRQLHHRQMNRLRHRQLHHRQMSRLRHRQLHHCQLSSQVSTTAFSIGFP
jgi:hypothetical protein